MTFWTLICVPIVLTVICLAAEVSHRWQARVQLENALEAAALAAVKEWGERGGGAENIEVARANGKAFAKANTVQGLEVDLDNPAVAPISTWCFGTAIPTRSGFEFRSAADAKLHLAVVVQATVTVGPFCQPAFRGEFTGSSVTAHAAAYYDPSSSIPRLIHLD